MSKNDDIALRCELGSVAMIVNSKFSVNRGIVVQVLEPIGFMEWPEIDTGLIPVWRVKVISKKSAICYHYPQKGELRKEKVGLVPDQFLCSLTPLIGQLRFKFEYYEPEADLELMAL
jgi:hypothetical protein